MLSWNIMSLRMFYEKEKIKKASFPFDWIFSNPKMINDCINDNFKIFLDRKLHIKIPNKPGKSGHKIYGDRIFNHYDITTNENFEYYVRCVKRFRQLLTKNNILFIHMQTNKTQKINEIPKDLDELYLTLKVK